MTKITLIGIDEAQLIRVTLGPGTRMQWPFTVRRASTKR